MKICSCIVIYNPSEEVISHVKDLLVFSNAVLVLDNSVSMNATSQKISKIPGINYISFHENKGLAYALKYGAEFSVRNKYDYMLTMDQDSIFPLEHKDDILNLLNKNPQYSILALNYLETKPDSKPVYTVNEWITSGSFIKLDDYQKIDGFNKDLFIDYVDYDLCEQMISKGFKIGVMNNIHLGHQLGEPTTKKILGKKITYSNHSPARDYYRYRNELYLYLKNKKYYRSLHKAERKNLIIIMLFEKKRLQKLKMIMLGKRHARKGHLGKLNVIK